MIGFGFDANQHRFVAVLQSLRRRCEFLSHFWAVFRSDLGMPQYWMINDRDKGSIGTSPNTGGLIYWVTDKTPLNVIGDWRKVSASSFETQLKAATGQLPGKAWP